MLMVSVLLLKLTFFKFKLLRKEPNKFYPMTSHLRLNQF